MNPLLTPDQVSAGVAHLRSYSGQPFSDEDAAMWASVLRRYHVGELAEALDRWARTEKGQYRPRPAELAPYLGSPPSKPLPAPGCAQCEDGWVDTEPRDVVGTVRPCELCKPEQFNAWRSGRFMPEPATPSSWANN